MVNEYYTSEEIQEKITIRPMIHDRAKKIVSYALIYVPKPIAEKVLSDSIFIILDPPEKAFYLSKEVIGGRHVFIFSSIIYCENEYNKKYDVLHEVAHFHLKHVPSKGQRKEEWEDEVDLLARDWIEAK